MAEMMENFPVKVIQKSLLGTLRNEFVFNELTLEFAQHYRGSGASYTVAYQDIPQESKKVWMINRRVRVAFALFWLALYVGVVESIQKIAGDAMLGITVAVMAALLFPVLWFAGRWRIALISFDTPRGRLQVLDDATTQDVLARIAEMRHRRILALFGAIDFSRRPQDEIKKFRWLQEHGYISAEQYEDTVGKINGHAGLSDDGVPDKGGFN